MMNRSLRSAVRSLASLRASSRSFSSTPAYGLRAVFTETQNEELNKIFKEIQEKIILPAYLPEKQRELVFDPKKRQQIQQNPIVIELDGLEHKFSYIDRFSEIPNSKKALNNAINSMQTKEDWDNLETLLGGYHKAGVKLHPQHWAKIIRAACQTGNSYAIIESAKQADKTGLALKRLEHVVGLLSGINLKISRSTTPEQKKKEAAQALRWNDIVLDLLHRPEHATEAGRPLYNTLFARHLFLFAKASAAQTKQQAGESIEAELEALKESVEQILALWAKHGTSKVNEIPDIQELCQKSEQNRGNPRFQNAKLGVFAHKEYIQVATQVLQSMALAQQLVPKTAAGLKPIQQALEKQLNDYVVEVSGEVKLPKPQWAELYEETTGQKPDWAAAVLKGGEASA